jgi:hypothetical protein
MTERRCWVEFQSDKSLQLRVSRGEFGEAGSSPLGLFPPPPDNNGWTEILLRWSRERHLTAKDEGLTVTVRVKKDQIEDFISFVYTDDPSYFNPAKMLTWKGRAYLANNLNDLRAFVAQQLSPRLWYELKADEF